MSEKIQSVRRPDLRELIALGSPWPATFRLAVLAQVVSMVFGLFFPLLIGKLVDAAVPSVKAIAPGSWQPGINTVALVLLSTLAIQAVLTFFYSAAFQSVGQRTVVRLRSACPSSTSICAAEILMLSPQSLPRGTGILAS